MERLRNLEFYSIEGDLWVQDISGRSEQLTEHSRDIIVPMYDRIREFYPEAFEILSGLFSSSRFSPMLQQYRVVKRFCKCNFSEIYQSKFDIDDEGRFRFEKVNCPLRGECCYENRICRPKFNSKISEAEMRVLEMIYRGIDKETIAEKLFLSIHTVNNHIRNAYIRIGIREKSEFIRYAMMNNIFEKK